MAKMPVPNPSATIPESNGKAVLIHKLYVWHSVNISSRHATYDDLLTVSLVFEVAVRGEPLVHADEDDDHESVEDEPGHHEAAPPLGPRGADDGE